jgi:uncharacterized protein YwqG
MYSTYDAARESLQRICRDGSVNQLSDAQIAVIATKLSPQLLIVSSVQASATGQSRLGGAPDLPRGLAWPIRAPDSDTIAAVEDMAAGQASEGFIREFARLGAPFSFIAQIDLAAASAHGAVAEQLPTTGRLLFFWDNVLGECFGGTAACRVIWDRSLAADLAKAVPPEAFQHFERIHAHYERASFVETIKRWRTFGGMDDSIAILDTQLATPIEQWPPRPFLYPAQAVDLVTCLQLPALDTVEAALDDQLHAIAEQQEIASLYYQLLESHDDFPTLDYPNSYGHRLLGLPEPEQEDPRFSLFEQSEDGWPLKLVRQHAVQASKWCLLMQIHLGALSQGTGSGGTVYFIVHRDDLAKGDFSQVQAWFQIT